MAQPDQPTKIAPKGAEHVCFPCKRKFPSEISLGRHVKRSDVHRRMIEKEADRMRKRKNEIIAAIQSVRQHLVEAEEAMNSSSHVNESVQRQRMLLDLQLQQLLREYAQAQSIIEDRRDVKETQRTGVEKPDKFHEVTVGGIKISAAAACWQGNKEFNEDRYVIKMPIKSPEGHDIAGFAVFDGHSGTLCVDHCVEKLGKNIQQCLSLKQTSSEENMIQAVNEACILTDDDFLKKAREREVLDGSTMILAIIYPDVTHPGSNGGPPSACRLLVANIGDSRAVLCTSRSLPGSTGGLMALPLSVDHKPNRDDEKERIEKLGGVVDFQGVWRVFTPGPACFGGNNIQRWGLAVSRSFGDLLLKEPEKYDCVGVAPGGLVSAVPEIQTMELQPDDDKFLVLACDGVWDVLSSEEAVSVCAEQESDKKAAETVLRRTYASNSDDNITAVVLTWKELAEHSPA